MNGYVEGSKAAMPIAIIGIGCRFPGGIVDTESFWRVLADGVDAIGEIPADRFDIAKYYDPKPGVRGRIMTKWGGFVEQRLEDYDAAFFGISRSYADRLDPQQRLLLETSWEALEDAGLDAVGLQGSATGIFVGQWTSDFEHRLFSDASGIDFQMAMGSGRYAAAGRLSYALGFRGPSLSIDAACSSGLASVHLAVRSLRSGDSAVALAGGVNMIMEPHIHLAYSYSKMMAPDGRCRFGDAAGKGYVRAEGAGMVVLKPLEAALADGDHVYAVIRGSAVNNDGNSSGAMGRPSRIGQEELLRSALNEGGVHASQLDYVEAHGTGTKAGDPVELGALATVLSEDRPAGASPTWVGSVKTNFGHTEAAAGVAGLIKAALMLERGMIPPSLHFETPNAEVPWSNIPIAIPTTLLPWPERSGSRFAGVSSYGIGGTNAHAVLESAPAVVAAPRIAAPAGTPLILPISGRGDAGARAVAAAYAARLDGADADVVTDFCWTAATRRAALTHRAAFVAKDRDALVALLRGYADGAPATAHATVHDRTRRRVAFVVPGQGAQWTGMARDFAAHSPVFRSVLAECDAAARAHVSWSIVEQLHLDEGDAGYLGHRIDVIQPTLIALALAYAAWLRSIGIEPDAVVGHSLGEVGAAAIAGVVSLPDAMRIICARSSLMMRTSGQGAMAVVELSPADVELRLAGYDGRVSVAVNNSPRSTVISGDPSSVQEILATLEGDGVFCRLVKVDVASHSPQMIPLATELVSSLSDIVPSAPSVALYSTVTGAAVTDASLDAAYWGRNLTQPVQFRTAVQQMLTDGIEAFVELGPHAVLTQAVQQVAQATSREVTAVACGRRNEPDLPVAMTVVAALWCAGAAIDWRKVMPWGARTISLPFYPWQRHRHWVDAADLRDVDAVAQRPKIDPALRGTLYSYEWQPIAQADDEPSRAGWRWIVVAAGQADAATQFAAALERCTGHATVVGTMHDAAVELRDVAGSGDRVGVVVMPAPLDALAYSPVQGLNELQRALTAASSSVAPRVWWLTVGAQRVPGDLSSASNAEVRGGAMWGAARVLSAEQPAFWGGLLDLDPMQSPEAQADQLAEFLSVERREDQVALRASGARALRVVPLPAQPSSPFAWRSDAAYLITGGFGGVARQLATAMVTDGARRLVLLSRTPLPPRQEWAAVDPASAIGQRVATVRALEHAGASVHLLCADVADEASMRRAIDVYHAEGWPRIDGIVHAAGVLDNQLSGSMTDAQFDAVMSAKVYGAEVLDRLFPDVSLFLLCSSIMAFWGTAGMANYAAANAGLDAMAMQRRARGQHAISVQWCVWQDTGMVDDARMRRNVAEMAQLGLRSISGAEGVACFEIALVRSEAVLTILPVDWKVFAAARRGRVQPIFAAIRDANVAESDAPDGWKQAIAGATGVSRRPLLESLVRTVVSEVLRRPPAQIGAREAFGSLGVDSLLALEIRTRLESALERPLSATLTWNYNTVTALAAHLGELLAPTESPASVPMPADVAPQPAAVGASTTEVGAMLGAIGALSDDEALRALRRRR